MVQRTFNVRLSVYASRKLTKLVEGKSRTAEQVAAMMLESHLFDYDDFTWMNGDPRGPREAFDLNEAARDLDEVIEEFRIELEKSVAPNAKRDA